MTKIKIGTHIVTITHPDKILFPQDKITKQDLVDYYQRIAPIMIPYIKNRPLTMHRFVNGITQEGFFQKNIADYFPSWIKRVEVKKQNEDTIHYLLCNDAATLVYIANQLAITSHVWLSRLPQLNYPDRMIFDCDPAPGMTFTQVKKVARALKKILDSLNLPAFIMTTGSRGVHVVVPLKPVHDFEYVRAVAHDIAQILVSQYPELTTLEMRKEKRGKKIFLDTLRNAWSATGVSPYSVRALPKAPVATPILWPELARVTTSRKYTIRNIFRRLQRTGDAWHDIDAHAVDLEKSQKKLKRLKD